MIHNKYKLISLLLITSFILIANKVIAQGEANNWYFGNGAGITFNSGVPVSLSNGALNTYEGCSTISDATGNLLFYSDGRTVYDRTHNAMPNGTGLVGNSSATQSGIIVPHPGNTNLFFVFSLDETAGPLGLRYSIVDLTLNGGLGDVTSTKNFPLHVPASEKITAVKHANGNDIWVITQRHGTGEYLSYLIDNNGLNTTPIISSIGLVTPFTTDAPGYMKVAPNGSQLACVYLQSDILELCEFDSSTGILTNAIQFSGFNSPANPTSRIYGVEYSPNSNYLYLSDFNVGIRQFDVSSFNQASIASSEILLTTINPPPNGTVDPHCALQLAPDGKIYVSHFDYNYLGVINNPNLNGNAADYQYDGLLLSTGVGQLGLPPFITTYFASSIIVQNTCLGDLTDFQLDANQGILSANWDFGDGNVSTQINPTHTYALPGDYTVTVTVTSATDVVTTTTDITIYEVPAATIPQNILVCDSDNDGFVEFDLTSQDAAILNGQAAVDFEVAYYANMMDYNNGVIITNPSSYTNTAPYGSQTIVASVRNVANTECEVSTTFDIQVYETPVPSLTVPDILVCDNDTVGTDADGLVQLDITTNETVIYNGQSSTDFELNYFSDASLTSVITNPVIYQNTNPTETIYVEMVNRNNSSCSATTSFEIQVLSLPTLNTPVQLTQCDNDTDGISFFNFNEVVDEITLSSSSNTVTFHTSQNDAENAVNVITNIANYQNTTPNTEILYARVENSVGCYRTAQVNLQVTTSQIPTSFLRTIYQCDDGVDLYDGIATFDMTSTQSDIEALFPAGQPILISYYRSELEALSELNEINNIAAYENISSINAQDIYVRVENANNNDCIGLGPYVRLIVEANPLATAPVVIEQCDINNDGTESIDTSGINAQLLQGQTGIDLVFRDISGTILPNPLPNPYTTSTQSITVEMTNNSSQDPDGACSIFTSIDITIDAGVVANPIPAFDVCDDDNDGLFSFDTSTLQSTILGTQTGVTVTYEDQNGNLLPSPLPNPFVSNTQTITATVVNPTNSFCFEQTNIDFIVNSVPTVNAIMNDIICDDISNDGQHLYDLTSYDNQLLNGQSLTTYSITYHSSQMDADSGMNILPNSYLCTVTSEFIYARIENSNNSSCYDTTSFEIGVSRLPIANLPLDIELCDDSTNNGVEVFDLTSQNITILNGQSPSDNIITYHNTQLDAEQGNTALPSNYTNTSNPETIYARVENVNNPDCYDVTLFDLIIYEQPVLLMKGEWTICENDSVEIIADSGYDNYLWSTGETTESIVVTMPGNYDVTVSNNYGTIICDETKNITVIESTIAVITNVEIEDWSQDNNSVYVEVQGTGDYEYSLDGITYQESNRFDNLPIGDYQLYVRDRNGCGIAEQDIYLLFYPRYFTPNGDNYHDFWQLYNSDQEPDNKIFIYDRYGKLLKQISATGIGWDGTYNGNPMPSNDYWFKVERSNGKTYNGHFTLKR